MSIEYMYVLLNGKDGCWIAYSLDQALEIMLTGCPLKGFAESEEGIDLLIRELMDH